MVHALNEIRRVLISDGILIDLRPMLDRWPIEVASAREIRETGRMLDFPLGLADDEAANRSMADAEQKEWFIRERQEFFPFFYSWDSPSELEEWIAAEWQDFIDIDEETKRTTRSAWALGDADSQVRVRMKMLITRWKKVTDADPI